jgi:hypothetical protein
MSANAPAYMDTAGGWHLVPRAWRTSEAYRALGTAEARHVAELILFDRPRYQDEEHMFGTETFTVRRGELFDSEESLAQRAGCSRKVLRTVQRKLEKAGLLGRRKVHPAGQCPRVITVKHYEASQRIPKREGPANGPANGTTEGPTDGPAKGPQGNEGTSGNLTQQHELLPSPAAPAGRKGKTDPRFAPLRAAWERAFVADRGEPYRWQAAKDSKAIHSLLAVTVDEFEARATRGLRGQGFLRCSTVATLASRWNDLSGAAATPTKTVTAPAAPSTAFVGGRREL